MGGKVTMDCIGEAIPVQANKLAHRPIAINKEQQQKDST